MNGLSNETKTAACHCWLVQQRHAVVAIVLAAMLCSGCSLGKSERWKFASWDVRKAVGLKKDKPDPETPTRIVTTWTEAVLHRTGESPKRGFGGRLAFFKNGSEDPIRVDGQLVVYAFDESGEDPYRTEPTKRYVFPAEQFARHEGESDVGPTYSVWLPWDDVGGLERKISLIARFEPKEGAIVVGEQTRHYLAGKPVAKPSPANSGLQWALTPTPAPVTAASYQAPISGAVVESGGQRAMATTFDPLATTSIPLPRKLSPTPGPSLLAARAAQQPAFMANVTAAPAQAGRVTQQPQGDLSVQATGQAAYALPPQAQSLQQSFAQSAATRAVWEAPIATAPETTLAEPAQTAGYLPAAEARQAAPPSVGYQSTPPLAPAKPIAQ